MLKMYLFWSAGLFSLKNSTALVERHQWSWEVQERGIYLQRDLDRSPEQDFDLVARFIEREPFSFSKQSVPGVVYNDIEATEVNLCRRERGFDLFIVHDIQWLNEQLLGGVLLLQVCEDFRLAKGRDDPFTTGEDGFDEAFAETR